jgi:hypothetical protein
MENLCNQDNTNTKPYILHVISQIYIFVTEIDSSINYVFYQQLHYVYICVFVKLIH